MRTTVNLGWRLERPPGGSEPQPVTNWMNAWGEWREREGRKREKGGRERREVEGVDRREKGRREGKQEVITLGILYRTAGKFVGH